MRVRAPDARENRWHVVLKMKFISDCELLQDNKLNLKLLMLSRLRNLCDSSQQ